VTSPPPSIAGAGRQTKSVATAPLQLAFQTPTSASVGEAFDVRVTLMGQQPVGRIAMDIAYDAALLKARGTEEVDYGQRPPDDRAFTIERTSDGQVAVRMLLGGGPAGQALPPSAAVVQFEALAPGGAVLRISGIAVWDMADQPVPWQAVGEENIVLIH